MKRKTTSAATIGHRRRCSVRDIRSMIVYIDSCNAVATQLGSSNSKVRLPNRNVLIKERNHNGCQEESPRQEGGKESREESGKESAGPESGEEGREESSRQTLGEQESREASGQEGTHQKSTGEKGGQKSRQESSRQTPGS